EKLTDQEIVTNFQSFKQELQSIATKVSELKTEKDDHELVIQTSYNSDRKYIRLITIKDVLPVVETN
ncbi:hypothetical protein U3516DRAFT_860554, partial [Neocallimastix sp. 'constans']